MFAVSTVFCCRVSMFCPCLSLPTRSTTIPQNPLRLGRSSITAAPRAGCAWPSPRFPGRFRTWRRNSALSFSNAFRAE